MTVEGNSFRVFPKESPKRFPTCFLSPIQFHVRVLSTVYLGVFRVFQTESPRRSRKREERRSGSWSCSINPRVCQYFAVTRIALRRFGIRFSTSECAGPDVCGTAIRSLSVHLEYAQSLRGARSDAGGARLQSSGARRCASEAQIHSRGSLLFRQELLRVYGEADVFSLQTTVAGGVVLT